MNIVLVPLMGLPSSGKSTLCTEMINRNYQFDEPTTLIVISYDDFVPISIQSKYAVDLSESADEIANSNLSVAKIFRKRFVRAIEFLVHTLTQSESTLSGSDVDELDKILDSDFGIPQLSEDQMPASFSAKLIELLKPICLQEYTNGIIIIDDNNYYHSMRNEIYQIAKKFKTGFCILFPVASIQDCLDRNSKRPNKSRVPESVILTMSKKLEEPDPLRNACDIFCVQISDVKDVQTHFTIQETLKSSLLNPIDVETLDRTDEIERERRICAENEIHQADQILRKWIHTETIKFKFSPSAGGDKNMKLKPFCQKLLERKNAVVAGLKSGELTVKTQLSDFLGFQQEILELAKMKETNIEK